MAFDVQQSSCRRRKGPGLTALVAVGAVVCLQLILLVVFQILQGSPEDVGDVSFATVHVEERVEEMTEPPTEQVAQPVRETPQVITAQPQQPEKESPEETEEELVRLLDRIEEEPKKEQTPGKAEIQQVDEASALLAQEKAKPLDHKKVIAHRTVKAPVQKKERLIHIVSAEQNRFPASAQTDEMRILNISLAELPGVDADISGRDVTLKVTFYDEIGDTGMAIPSRVQTSLNPIRLKDRQWKNNARYLVTATYMVPKGFRDDYRQKTGTRLKYYGYIIELYYDEVLQDVKAQPKTLVKFQR